MPFHPEQIELLWLIPVFALVAFIFILQFASQKKEQTGLSREVERFNTGSVPYPQGHVAKGGDRLSQLEQAISAITDSLTAQQQALTQVRKGSANYSGEITDLKAKLRELYTEYDIVLSENYSLKAKVKKLQEGGSLSDDPTSAPSLNRGSRQSDIESNGATTRLSSKVDMKLYEDTRTLNLAQLDDTSEIDVNELLNRKKK